MPLASVSDFWEQQGWVVGCFEQHLQQNPLPSSACEVKQGSTQGWGVPTAPWGCSAASEPHSGWEQRLLNVFYLRRLAAAASLTRRRMGRLMDGDN